MSTEKEEKTLGKCSCCGESSSWIKYYGHNSLPKVLRVLADIIENSEKEKHE